MRALLVAINAKYSHTNLALRYLKNMIINQNVEVELREFTINQNTNYILAEIYKTQADTICFSCYIWNIDLVLTLCKTLKKIRPDIVIVLGGPEVSYEIENMMSNNDFIDIVLAGEAEKSYQLLMDALETDSDYSEIQGISYRAKGSVHQNPIFKSVFPMSELPFPYKEGLPEKDRIIYYEASRGCPFNCQYCLSSTDVGVRYLPLERIKKELLIFINAGVRQVKFIDRTFNADKNIALEIMKFLVNNNNNLTNFHFEITADIMDDEMLSYLKNIPKGLFQFEIGVQSTNEKTLQEIDRIMTFAKISSVVSTILGYNNIHLHLDLIVGLPHEDFFSFRKSFDDVFALRPNKLQIGFLKMLKGSKLRKESEKYGYIFNENAPYEIIQNKDINFRDLISIKGIEEMVEIYWNSRQFNSVIKAILHNFYSSQFNFFNDLYVFWEKSGYHHKLHSKNKLFEIIYEFYLEMSFDKKHVFLELLKYDYLKSTKTSSLPAFMNRIEEKSFKNKCHEYLQTKENVTLYLPAFTNLSAKQIVKKVHFEQFNYDVHKINEFPAMLLKGEKSKIVILFDYNVAKREVANSKNFILIGFENKKEV
ncbi:MAG: B12-binding domain-containing radical SAM protein [Alkaliphilus sp.]|nr:MAG: B12-binding domain-containing radical SAM protein [Alkaliphilus sp.]